MLHSSNVGNGGPAVTRWARGADYRDINSTSINRFSDLNHSGKCQYRIEDPTHRCDVADRDHSVRCEYNVQDGTVRCKYNFADRDGKCKYNNGGKHSSMKCKYSKVYCDDHNEDNDIAYIEDDGFV